MTNLILIDEKRGHRIDIYQMHGKERYAVIDSWGIFKDSPIIPDTRKLDDIVTKLINNGYTIYEGAHDIGDIRP